MIKQPNNTINFFNELEGARMDTTSNQVLPPNPLSNIGYILKSPFGQAGIQYTQTAISQASSNYFSTVFNKDIRYYFDVDNQYVISKLLVILFPFAYKGDWKKTKENYNSLHQGFLSPKEEIHSPDLYIPLMALMTFVLTSCLRMGVGDQFQPSFIGGLLGKCIFVTLVESSVIKLILLYFKTKNVAFLEIVSHISYKYVGLFFIMLVKLFFDEPFPIISKIYFCFISVIFVYKTFRRYTFSSIGDSLGMDGDFDKGLVMIAILQIFFSWVLVMCTSI